MSTAINFLSTVSPAVRQFYEPRNLLLHRRVLTQSAFLRLVTDERMRASWKKLGENFKAIGSSLNDPDQADLYFAYMTIVEFENATTSTAWDQMTQREKELWQGRLLVLVNDFEKLVECAPSHPDGSALPPEMLDEFAIALGFDVIQDGLHYFDPFESGANRRARGEPLSSVEIAWVAKESNLTIKSSLQRYQAAMAQCGTEQPLKRPRDSKAQRARFIVGLTSQCSGYFGQLMQELVAVTAEVMFEDPTINVRLVRRLTRGR